MPKDEGSLVVYQTIVGGGAAVISCQIGASVTCNYYTLLTAHCRVPSFAFDLTQLIIMYSVSVHTVSRSNLSLIREHVTWQVIPSVRLVSLNR